MQKGRIFLTFLKCRSDLIENSSTDFYIFMTFFQPFIQSSPHGQSYHEDYRGKDFFRFLQTPNVNRVSLILASEVEKNNWIEVHCRVVLGDIFPIWHSFHLLKKSQNALQCLSDPVFSAPGNR